MAADITVNLNDADDAVLIRLTAEYNANPLNVSNPLTKAQFFREHTRDWIRSHRSRFFQFDSDRDQSAKEKATDAEKAIIESILSKYR
jgi:hypothetical protein